VGKTRPAEYTRSVDVGYRMARPTTQMARKIELGASRGGCAPSAVESPYTGWLRSSRAGVVGARLPYDKDER